MYKSRIGAVQTTIILSSSTLFTVAITGKQYSSFYSIKYSAVPVEYAVKPVRMTVQKLSYFEAA